MFFVKTQRYKIGRAKKKEQQCYVGGWGWKGGFVSLGM
jgi:hypothetical protein